MLSLFSSLVKYSFTDTLAAFSICPLANVVSLGLYIIPMSKEINVNSGSTNSGVIATGYRT